VPTFAAGDIGTCSGCGAGEVYAGAKVITHVALSPAQQGVPVGIFLDTASSAQANGDTTMSVTATTAKNGSATATFSMDTGAGATLYLVSNITNPSQPTGVNGASLDSAGVTTIAGPAAGLVLKTYFDSTLLEPTSHAVNGTTLYVDVAVADKYGNPTLNSFNYQIQITLSGPGTFSATSVYIASGESDTAASFGTILWHAPNAFGAQTLTAKSIFPTATASVKLVSSLPTFAVTSPTPVSGVIYSPSTAVTFIGQANASLGYPASANIASIGYKIDSGTWQSAAVTAANKITWAVSVSLAAGLHTVQFNATDDQAPSTAVSQKFSVLVDTAAQNINFITKNNANISAGSPVTATIVDSMGDLNATSVSASATNIDTAATAKLTASVTGSNNLGHSVSYPVSITGLTTGNWSVTLSTADLAKNSNSSSITIHVTVAPGQSFVVSGTPSSCTLGGFSGVCVNYQNLNPTTQNVVVFAVFKNSASQTVGIGTGSASFVAGGSQSMFIADPVGLASGSYSVSIFVFTTGNVPVSASTSISVTV